MGTASRATAWRRESFRARSFGGFLKTGHLPGFHGPSKTMDQIFIKMAARGEDFIPKKEPQPSDEIVYRGMLQTNRSDRSLAPV